MNPVVFIPPAEMRLEAPKVKRPLHVVLKAQDSQSMSQDDRAWMNADLSHLGGFEPYEWGEADPREGLKPVKFIPGKGFMILDES